MARTNYSYEKRQKELAKKAKKEEKLKRKQAKSDAAATQGDAPPAAPGAEKAPG